MQARNAPRRILATPTRKRTRNDEGRDAMNTREINKVVGALVGALLVYLGVQFFAEMLFEGEHAGDDHHYAYAIEVEDEGGDDAAEAIDLPTLLAAADASRGERVFAKCKACHKVDGTDGTGPHLNGVVGRAVGGVGGYIVATADRPGMSPGLLSGGFLFLSGVTRSGPVGAMPAGDAAQFEAVFDKIEGVLAAADLPLDALVEMTSWHIGLRGHFEAFDAVRRRRLAPPYPAWTAVEAAGLRRQGAVVEVRAIAAAPTA